MSNREEVTTNGNMTTHTIYVENTAVASETVVVSTAELDKSVEVELQKTVENESAKVEELVNESIKKEEQVDEPKTE